MKFNYNKLRGRIVEKYGTLSNFSEAIGISFVALSKKMNNLIAISQKEIIKWSELLDIAPNEIGVYFFTLEVQNNWTDWKENIKWILLNSI